MVNNIITAVSAAIYNEFGEDYRIYTDNVEQGLTRPCFLINVIRPSNSERLMGRSYLSVPLVIQYFPKTLIRFTECNSVADRLFSCLRYPKKCLRYPKDVEETYRGTKMKYDMKNDRLNFYVQYNLYTLTVNDKDSLMYDVSESIESQRKDDK